MSESALAGFARRGQLLSAPLVILTLAMNILLWIPSTAAERATPNSAFSYGAGSLFRVGNLRYFAGAFLGFALLSLLASRALSRGKRWGYIAWLGLLAISCLWCLGWVIVAIVFPDLLVTGRTSRGLLAGPLIPAGFISIVGLTCLGLLLWTIRRLRSREVLQSVEALE